MILSDRHKRSLVVRVLRNFQHRRNVETLCLPVLNSFSSVNHFDMTNGFFQRAETKLCEILTHFFGDVLKEVHNKLGLTREP